VALVPELGDFPVEVSEGRLGGLPKPLSLLGQGDAARPAIEDREPEVRFQSADLVTYGALGEVQFCRGRREAEMAGHHIEQAQAVVRSEAHVSVFKKIER
jgi:hypothetical protein